MLRDDWGKGAIAAAEEVCWLVVVTKELTANKAMQQQI